MLNSNHLGRRLCSLAIAIALAGLLGGCTAVTSAAPAAEETPAAKAAAADKLPEAGEEGPAAVDGEEEPAEEATTETEAPAPDEAGEPEAAAASQVASGTVPTGTPAYRDLPAYDGNPYVYVNGGEPAFTDSGAAPPPSPWWAPRPCPPRSGAPSAR